MVVGFGDQVQKAQKALTQGQQHQSIMRFIHVFLLWLATVIMASPTPEPQEKPDSTSPNNKEDNNQVTAQRDRNLGRWGTIGAGAIGLVGGVLGTLGVQRFQTIRHREQFEQWLAGVDEYNFGTAWTAPQVIDCMSRKVFLLQPTATLTHSHMPPTTSNPNNKRED